MPSVGIPSSRTSVCICGAPSAYTDAGPPERISASGLRARTSRAVMRWLTISEYTRASRTRRAISWLYWPPKSSTSTGRSSGAAAAAGAATGKGRISALSATPVIRCVLRDRDVVRVALADPGSGDADEPALRLERLDGRGAAVPHRLPEPADELVDDRGDRPLVRDAPLDPLGHELVDVLDVTLEVAILRERPRLHRSQRPHPPVLLEPLALDEDHVARRLVRARKHGSEHHRVRSGRDRLRNVSGRGDAAV